MTTAIPLNPMPTRLLCVDDDPLIGQSLGALLNCVLPTWDIRIEQDPAAVLLHLQTQDMDNPQAWQPDVVISDMMMPGMSGLAFLTGLKACCPNASLLMLTGYADKQSAITAINELGLFYYLEKPWHVDTLPVILKKAAEHSQLRHHLHQADLALQHAQTIGRMREDFVATLTHDLRTPLLASEQTLGLLLAGKCGPLSPKQGEVVTMLQQNQQDLLQLVNRLLMVYQFEAGQAPLALTPINLNDWLPTVLKPLQALTHNKQQQLDYQHTPMPVVIQADGFALQRVITNLVGNAISYTPEQGRIVVQVCVIADSAVIQICDNGRGIPKNDIPQLFQRFAQGSSRVRHSGSGLGLYLCRQIVEAHHGTISVNSEENQGSVFTVTLPLAASIAARPELATNTSPPLAAPTEIADLSNAPAIPVPQPLTSLAMPPVTLYSPLPH
jgi:two-component system, sensor histidine kinase and response regulator